jgi:Fe-S oxidoreductase/nitrate reductase gamma subunit
MGLSDMPVRETFWNIPHWAEIGQYLLGLLAILVFTYGVFRRVRRWRMGRPERRTDRLGTRVMSVLTQAVGQRRTTQSAYPGIMHLMIFWGMAALLLGTILATLDWDGTHLFFGTQFLTGGIYVVYELILDVLGLLVLTGLLMAAYRRYVLRPPRLQNMPVRGLARDDAYVLVMLALVATTGYLIEGLRIAVVRPDWAPWSPVGNALASVFTGLGDPTNRNLHLALWIGHALIAFTFIATIPFTKLFHFVAAPLNIFFRSLQPAGALAPARQGNEPGVKEWRDFTWKQILDFESCTRCGRCQDQCPAHASGLSLSPRDVMIKLDAHVWQRGNGHALHGDVIKAQELWACTTCRACVQVCPVFTDPLTAIVDMRRYQLTQPQADTMLMGALTNLRRYGNSFGQSERKRAMWSADLTPPIKDIRREPAHTLWYVGDYASYSPTLTAITQATARVFQKAGVDFGLLYDAERNAGNDVRRVGEEGLFEMLATKNKMALASGQFKEIVTTDPHTYNTLKNEYALDGSDGSPSVPVLHYTEVLDRAISSGKLPIKRKLGYTVTYHDPCYLGRYNDVYDAPRRVLEAIGCHLVEMPRNRDRSLCCGAGGGRIWMEETGIKERPSENRIREAVTLGNVPYFVVACPKDLTMYRDAVKTAGQEDRIEVKDMIELVEEALG